MKAGGKTRHASDFSTLDDILAEDGRLEAIEAAAIKEVLAWQIEQAMKDQKLSRKRLAERMGTSRSQISRLLDPKDGMSLSRRCSMRPKSSD